MPTVQAIPFSVEFVILAPVISAPSGLDGGHFINRTPLGHLGTRYVVSIQVYMGSLTGVLISLP